MGLSASALVQYIFRCSTSSRWQRSPLRFAGDFLIPCSLRYPLILRTPLTFYAVPASLGTIFPFAILSFCAAEKLHATQERAAAPHTAARPELHVPAVESALCLGRCGRLIYATATGSQGIEFPDFYITAARL